MTHDRYKVGDPVVYQARKCTPHPGPRARDIRPAPAGEDYSYVVDKYWIVHEVRQNGSLELRTRRGKLRVVAASDPELRPATWWERLTHRSQFPRPAFIGSDRGPSGA